MRILIAHQSQLIVARLRHQVSTIDNGTEVLEALTLTDTYNLAEHHAPDCVVIDEGLANLAEFELLASLLRVMKITCFVVSKETTGPRLHPFGEKIPIIQEKALSEEIKKSEFWVRCRTRSIQDDNVLENSSVAYDQDRIILIGASTGGIDALLTITKHFDEQSPPVLIVQHTGGSFSKSLIRLLNGAGVAAVVAAEDGMSAEKGHVYFAPNDHSHLALSPTRRAQIALLQSGPFSGHRPSVDVLFSSALHCAPNVSAAILTGMGKDGAAGLTALRKAGAYTIGQDQRTSVVFGMPRVAMEMGGVCAQLPLNDIGPALLKSCEMRHNA